MSFNSVIPVVLVLLSLAATVQANFDFISDCDHPNCDVYEKLPKAAKIGIIAGGGTFILLLIALLICCMRRVQRRRTVAKPFAPPEEPIDWPPRPVPAVRKHAQQPSEEFDNGFEEAAHGSEAHFASYPSTPGAYSGMQSPGAHSGMQQYTPRSGGGYGARGLLQPQASAAYPQRQLYPGQQAGYAQQQAGYAQQQAGYPQQQAYGGAQQLSYEAYYGYPKEKASSSSYSQSQRSVATSEATPPSFLSSVASPPVPARAHAQDRQWNVIEPNGRF